jgi:hypothetical protein
MDEEKHHLEPNKSLGISGSGMVKPEKRRPRSHNGFYRKIAAEMG